MGGEERQADFAPNIAVELNVHEQQSSTTGEEEENDNEAEEDDNDGDDEMEDDQGGVEEEVMRQYDRDPYAIAMNDRDGALLEYVHPLMSALWNPKATRAEATWTAEVKNIAAINTATPLSRAATPLSRAAAAASEASTRSI